MEYNKTNFEQDAFTMSGQSREGICGQRTGVRTRRRVRCPETTCAPECQGERRRSPRGECQGQQGVARTGSGIKPRRAVQ